jgi:hypothetical protein
MSVKQVKSLDDLSLPESGTVDIPRGSSFLRVPIKAISLSEQEALTEEYKTPGPPKKMDKTGQKTDSGKPGLYFDPDDPVYLRLIDEINTKQSRALAIKGIDITIEGESLEDKWAALSQRLTVGDLTMILGAILELSNISDEKVDEAKKSLTSGP